MEKLIKSGIELITEERNRQIESEGYTPEHDSEHTDDSIACAAAMYALPERHRHLNNWIPFCWQWSRKFWKPSPDNRIKELVKAGALIAAEIDRLQKMNL
ncbi:hypothetical protein M0Q50_07300 [bacterium]|jgi:hypothetical protein|nr:hypothetical protein [bacterium]